MSKRGKVIVTVGVLLLTWFVGYIWPKAEEPKPLYELPLVCGFETMDYPNDYLEKGIKGLTVFQEEDHLGLGIGLGIRFNTPRSERATEERKIAHKEGTLDQKLFGYLVNDLISNAYIQPVNGTVTIQRREVAEDEENIYIRDYGEVFYKHDMTVAPTGNIMFEYRYNKAEGNIYFKAYSYDYFSGLP